MNHESQNFIYTGLARNKFPTSESSRVRSIASNEPKFVVQNINMMRLSFIKKNIIHKKFTRGR